MTLDRFVDLCVIRDCIRHCARVRDGRGAWRAERACAQLLGGTTIDQHTAAAARAFGEWLRTVTRSSGPATSLLAGPSPSAGASRPGATSSNA